MKTPAITPALHNTPPRDNAGVASFQCHGAIVCTKPAHGNTKIPRSAKRLRLM
jgi:hypothetical protein